jgi:hypothetical protein
MPEHDLPEISVSEEKLCFIIEKAIASSMTRCAIVGFIVRER